MTKNNPPIHSSVSIGRATRQCTLQSNGNKTKSFFLYIFPFSFLSASFRCLDIRILRIKCTASQLPTASPPLTDRKTYLVRNRFPSSFCCFDSRSYPIQRFSTVILLTVVFYNIFRFFDTIIFFDTKYCTQYFPRINNIAHLMFH